MSCTQQRLALLAVGVVGLTWVFGGTARAVDFEAAKRHYTSARKHYADKAYAKAAEQFHASYEIGKDPAVLFDTGDAWEHVGDEAGAVQAVKNYRQYILDDPRGAHRNDAEKRIAALEQKFKLAPPVAGPASNPPAPRAPHSESAPQASAASPITDASTSTPSPAATPAVAAPAPATTETSKPAASSDVAAPVAAPPEPGSVPAAAPADVKAPEPKALIGEDRLTPLRKAAWGMVAGSIALVTAGAILGLAAQERGDEITRQQMAPGPDGQPQLYTAQLESDLKTLHSEGASYNAAGIALMSTAGASAVVAAVLFGVDVARGKKAPANKDGGDKASSPRVSVLPSVSTRHAGLAAAVVF